MKPLGWIVYANHLASLSANISLIEKNNDSDSCHDVMKVFISDKSLKKSAFSLLATPRHTSRILSATRLNGQKVIAKRYTIHSDSIADPIGELILFIDTDRINDVVLKNLFVDQICPSIDCAKRSKIKQKTKDIVKMIALGLERQEISELFNLTRRGIDYHIDVAKEVLGATNKSSMVFLAIKQGWLTGNQQSKH
ncbi:helix-turn-helix transcriptional regulator [Shewanella atlantica]|uniref:Uncharacterized protein n=1 Tax=Shewanella atlantica TaxID=271099 RepID=A0A3S0KSS4_9GAMM|nr:hypothetical protein [Shewanella atlantica]RTR33586.1 hypothetical protein EKG39_07650 [Shewanella atlantica]